MERFKFSLFLIFSLISATISQETTDFTEAYSTDEVEVTNTETTEKTISEMTQEQTDMVKKIVSETTEEIQKVSQSDNKKERPADDTDAIRKILSQMDNDKPGANINDSEMIREIITRIQNADKPLSFSEKEKQYIEELKLRCKFFGLIHGSEETPTQQQLSDFYAQQMFTNNQQFSNHMQQQQNNHAIQAYQNMFQINPIKNPNMNTFPNPIKNVGEFPSKNQIPHEFPPKNQHAQYNQMFHQGQLTASNLNKPFYVQQTPGNNYFYWYPQNAIRTNKLTDTLQAKKNATVSTSDVTSTSHNHQITIQHDDETKNTASTNTYVKMNITQGGKLKYVRLEPLILQKTVLPNGQTLLQWYRLVPSTQGFMQIPDIPENDDVDAIAQPQTQPTQPLPDEYLYYVDPLTGAIIRNTKLQEPTTQKPVAQTPDGSKQVIKGRIQYYINPQTGMIYPPYVVAMNQRASQGNHHHASAFHTNLHQHHQNHHSALNQNVQGFSNQVQDIFNHDHHNIFNHNHQDTAQQVNQDPVDQIKVPVPNQNVKVTNNQHDNMSKNQDKVTQNKDQLNQNQVTVNQNQNTFHQNQNTLNQNQISLSQIHQDQLNQQSNLHQQQSFQNNVHQNNLIQDHIFHHHQMGNLVPNHMQPNDPNLLQDHLYHHNQQTQNHDTTSTQTHLHQQQNQDANHSHRVTYGYWPQIIQQPPIPHTTETPITTTTTTTTTQPPKTSIQYTIDYSQYDKFQDRYKNQYRFVLPMVVGGNQQDLTKYPIDPYAYLPKEQRPDFWKISVPYVPNYHMIKAIAVPKKYTETQEELENVNLK